MGDQVVEGIRIKNNKTSVIETIPISGLFIAIGHKPNTDLFKGEIEMDESGYLITKNKTTHLSLIHI